MKNKIILVNMGAYGDILNTTPIAKHHKIVDPECEIVWVTREKYKSAIKNNKFIDKILIVEEKNENIDNVRLTYEYIQFFKQKNINAKFVAPYSTLFNKKPLPPARSTLLNIVQHETSGIEDFACDFIPNVFLSEEEKSEAQTFFNKLHGDKKIVLEYENFSEQSPFNEKYFLALCESINNKNIDLIFTGKRLPHYFTNKISDKYNINFYFYDGSFMSNAELYNLCDAFVGTSSGITCLTHSDYCDTEKLRIEVCYGYHWSTFDWKHMKNKKIVFYEKQFKKALEGIQ